MSNLRKFVDAVRTGDAVPRCLLDAAADDIERRLNAAALGGKNSKRPAVKTDAKSVQTRLRVQRFRNRRALE
jgi:hypothetical protein